jgi:hypothetical protein
MFAVSTYFRPMYKSALMLSNFCYCVHPPQLDDGERKKFRVNCLRGSPQFIAYQDRFGVANASRLDELIFQKREEQKFNSMIEKQLKLEQERFAKVIRAPSTLACMHGHFHQPKAAWAFEILRLDGCVYAHIRKCNICIHTHANLHVCSLGSTRTILTCKCKKQSSRKTVGASHVVPFAISTCARTRLSTCGIFVCMQCIQARCLI